MTHPLEIELTAAMCGPTRHHLFGPETDAAEAASQTWSAELFG
jgi:hypothetical protein